MLPHDADLRVEAVWAVERSPRSVLVLPDGCVDVVAYQGRLRVVGPMTHAMWVAMGDAPVSGIRFRPGVVARWLGCDLAALRDRLLPSGTFGSLRGAHELSQILEIACGTAISWDARHAAQLICDEPERPIAQIARMLGASERQLHRLFVAEIGLAPKVFSRIQRLQRLAAGLTGRPEASLATLAAACGYADQAHMTREVRALCGIPPVALRRVLSDSFKTGPAAS